MTSALRSSAASASFVGVQVLVLGLGLGLLIAWPSLVLREAPAAPLDAATVERALERAAPPPAEQPTDPVQMLMENMRGPR